jgi:hypothetical protein
LARKVNPGTELRKHIRKYTLNEKVNSIYDLLGQDAQKVVDWAYEEARRQIEEDKKLSKKDLGRLVYELIGTEAAVRLVKKNHSRGRLTTKSEVRKRTGQTMEMPVLYRQAGLRHPQEARNLRHNIFHRAFMALITKLFPDVETSVPQTGEGLTPDLIVTHKNPDWTISVEYKGYRSLTLLSESELLKAMRYKDVYGTAWLVTTTNKTVKTAYTGQIHSKQLVKQGVDRLKRVYKRKAFTNEQKENRGIARKGISHLEKHKDLNLSCKLYTADELLESMKAGEPVKGVIITSGFELIGMLEKEGLDDHAENVLRVMKTPTTMLRSDSVTSVRLIE